VPADAVEEVEHRVLLVLRVARRGVDPGLARDADGLRVVLDRLQPAPLDVVTLLVEALRRRREPLRPVVLLCRGGQGPAVQPTPREQGHDASAHGSSFRGEEEVGPLIGRHPGSSAPATLPSRLTSVSASPGWRAPSIRARIDSPAAQSRRYARRPFAVTA